MSAGGPGNNPLQLLGWCYWIKKAILSGRVTRAEGENGTSRWCSIPPSGWSFKLDWTSSYTHSFLSACFQLPPLAMATNRLPFTGFTALPEFVYLNFSLWEEEIPKERCWVFLWVSGYWVSWLASPHKAPLELIKLTCNETWAHLYMSLKWKGLTVKNMFLQKKL
jgi:hypothetical protein